MKPGARRASAAGLIAAALLGLGAATGAPSWLALQGRAWLAAPGFFDTTTLAPAAVPRALPPAPGAPMAWPGPHASQAAAHDWLAANGTVALVVLRDGRLLHEAYFGGFTRETAINTFSVAKSMVSMLVGMALADGRLESLDDPIARHLPELRATDARYDALTWRHLLLMRSGLAFGENYRSPLSDVSRLFVTRDIDSHALHWPLAGAPDRAFAYQSGNTQLIALALERALGEPLARYAERRLWQPMGAEFAATWSVDSAARGRVKAFCCLNARAVDLARMGQVMLDGGPGGTLLPEAWRRESTAVQARAGERDAARRNIDRAGSPRRAFYAHHWRRAVDADGEPVGDFYAQGVMGQYVYVAPDERIVIVRLGHHQGDVFWPAWLGALARTNGAGGPRALGG